VNGPPAAAAITGLVIAWAGTALLVSPPARVFDDPSRVSIALIGQALFWVLAAVAVLSVLCWEKQPLRSLWLQPFQWQSIAWRLFLTAAYYTILFPSAEWAPRLAMLTGRIWLAALITLTGFCLLHVPLWGWGFALEAFVSGAAAMAFFIWRRDLLAMIVFHIGTDLMGIVIAPMFSEWWRRPGLY